MLTQAMIEGAVRGDKPSLRNTLQAILAQMQVTQQATGTAPLTSTNASGQTSAAAPPPLASINVTGANGVLTVALNPVALAVPAPMYYEVSYSADNSFNSGVTTLPVSSATSASIAAPGQQLFVRARTSYDRKTWSSYSQFGSAVDAGLQTSAATSPNMPLNQSNAAVVDSILQGSTVTVRVYGASGGPGTPWVNAAGRVFPSASLVGITPGSDAFVAFDPDAAMYRVRSRLSDVFPDSWFPVGKVSVVQTANPSLPTITAVVQSGSVVGFNVTNKGNGITAPLTITISGTGTGATAGAQTIQGGQLQSVAPGNAGSGYGSGTTVTASGGQYGGAVGGGGTAGGNGGRLTNV